MGYGVPPAAEFDGLEDGEACVGTARAPHQRWIVSSTGTTAAADATPATTSAMRARRSGGRHGGSAYSSTIIGLSLSLLRRLLSDLDVAITGLWA